MKTVLVVVKIRVAASVMEVDVEVVRGVAASKKRVVSVLRRSGVSFAKGDKHDPESRRSC